MSGWAVVVGFIDPYEGVQHPDEVLVGFETEEEAEEYVESKSEKLEYYFVVEAKQIK